MVYSLLLLYLSRPINAIGELVSDSLKELTDKNWQRLYKSLEEIFLWTKQPNHRYINFDIANLPETLDIRVATVLAMRSKNPKDFYSKYFGEECGHDVQVLQFWQNVIIELLGEGKISWQDALKIISQSYMNGVVSERYAFHRFIRRVPVHSMPHDVARKIAQQPDCYPGFLVAMAEARCREAIISKIVKVGEIANRDRWFSV
jgi:hypothetical protein